MLVSMAIMQVFAGGGSASRVDFHLVPKLLHITPRCNRLWVLTGRWLNDQAYPCVRGQLKRGIGLDYAVLERGVNCVTYLPWSPRPR